MERKLIDYLPHVVRDYAEYQGLMAGEQPEFERTWDRADELLDNQFVLTAGNLGLSRWEKILKIVPKGFETVENRRTAVLSKLNQNLPVTFLELAEWLNTICKSDCTSLHINEYMLQITLPVNSNYTQILNVILHRIPINIGVILTIISNQEKIEAFIATGMRIGKRGAIGMAAVDVSAITILSDESGNILLDEAGNILLDE